MPTRRHADKFTSSRSDFKFGKCCHRLVFAQDLKSNVELSTFEDSLAASGLRPRCAEGAPHCRRKQEAVSSGRTTKQ
jgi:hypothetical protein